MTIHSCLYSSPISINGHSSSLYTMLYVILYRILPVWLLYYHPVIKTVSSVCCCSDHLFVRIIMSMLHCCLCSIHCWSVHHCIRNHRTSISIYIYLHIACIVIMYCAIELQCVVHVWDVRFVHVQLRLIITILLQSFVVPSVTLGLYPYFNWLCIQHVCMLLSNITVIRPPSYSVSWVYHECVITPQCVVFLHDFVSYFNTIQPFILTLYNSHCNSVLLPYCNVYIHVIESTNAVLYRHMAAFASPPNIRTKKTRQLSRNPMHTYADHHHNWPLH